MLVKDPERRCASARDILRELRRLQMEIFGQDWPEELPGWESLAGETTPDLPIGRHPAARQSDENPSHRSNRPRHRYRWFLLALAGTFLLGMVLARLMPPPSRFCWPMQNNSGDIPKQPNVFQQWYYASKIGTEEAWKSIIENFKDKGYFVDRANQQLALIYLREKRYEEAIEIFEDLVNLGEDESELRAFGLAGQGYVVSSTVPGQGSSRNGSQI